jgi:hypothetical protein
MIYKFWDIILGVLRKFLGKFVGCPCGEVRKLMPVFFILVFYWQTIFLLK